VVVIGFLILILGDERPRPAYATCAQLEELLAKIRHAAATASGKRAGMTSVGQAAQRIRQMAPSCSGSAALDWELASPAIIHTGKGTSHTTSARTHLYWGRGW
jgi:hypothetical protein